MKRAIHTLLFQLGTEMEQRRRWQQAALCLLSLLVVAQVDAHMGTLISISVFYLIPVALAAWYTPVSYAVLIAVLGMLLELQINHGYTQLTWFPTFVSITLILRACFVCAFIYMCRMLHALLRQERESARTDALTGLLNRRGFIERMDAYLGSAQRRHECVAVVYIDLDNFKEVNDTRGHAAGDHVLQLCGIVLKEHTRRSDTVARLGGDEFGVILSGNPEHCLQVARALNHVVNTLFERHGYAVTCSIGCVLFDDPVPPSVDEAIAASDSVMYLVKKQGKNAVHCYNYRECKNMRNPE